jgi:REP element-mobilizing transposase RayT
MEFSHRRLPHWRPDGKPLFLTWRLHGSLPANRYVPPRGLTGGRAFVWFDRFLDQAQYGPTWLRREDIAQAIVDALHYGAETLAHYQLHAYVVMANHVHALVTPEVDPSKLLHSLKGFTAHEANKMLGRTGEPFWQRECYDHWVLDDEEFARIRAYIENNPLKAGLVARAEDFRWSSAYRVGTTTLAGTTAGSQAG